MNSHDPNQWAIINPESTNPLALRPIADRILVMEDKFRSGYECKICKGEGHTGEACSNCKGTRMEEQEINGERAMASCRACTIGKGDGRKTLGYRPCGACSGQGGLLVIPDDNQRRSTTGKVIAAGEKVTYYKVGTRVLFTNYTGSPFVLEGITLRLMKEEDALAEARYLKEDKAIEEKRYREFEETGI